MPAHIRIGELLLRDGVITRDELDTALRAQVVHGGRLGTNVIERCNVDLDRIAEALGKQHHMAVALQRHFDGADPTLQRSLPPELAERYRAVPLGTVSGGDEQFAVAVMDPLDADATGHLRAALGRPIVLAVASELRIYYYLERLYDLERPTRFLRVRKGQQDPSEFDDPETDPGKERRRYVETLADEPTDPGRRARLARIHLRRIPVTEGAEPAVDPTCVDEVIAAVRRAHDRRPIGELVVQAMQDGFDRKLSAGILLTIRGNAAMGWKGFARESPVDVKQIAIPLAEPSVIATGYSLTAPSWGRPPAPPSAIDKRLWEILGVPTPGAIYVCPVRPQDEAACILYAQGDIHAKAAEDLEQLGRAVGKALLRLFRAAQR